MNAHISVIIILSQIHDEQIMIVPRTRHAPIVTTPRDRERKQHDNYKRINLHSLSSYDNQIIMCLTLTRPYHMKTMQIKFSKEKNRFGHWQRGLRVCSKQ